MANHNQIHDPPPRQMPLPFIELKTFNLHAGHYRRTEAVQEAYRATISDCQLSRPQIAEEMSRILTEDITLSHINNWAAASKKSWRIPLEYAAAFCAVTNDYRVIKAAFAGSGINILDDSEMVFYEIGKAEEEKREMAVRLKENRNRLKTLKMQGRL